MLDVSRMGESHVQIFHTAGLSAHSIFLTRNEALDMLEKLRLVLEQREPLPALVPDD